MSETETMTGYQWGRFGAYIGNYDFPINLNSADVHIPPNTTLTPPPGDIPAGSEAVYDLTSDSWVIRSRNLVWVDTATLQAMFMGGALTAEQIIAGHPGA